MPRGRGHRGFRRRWGRGMRVVEPMMLLLLAQEPAHGYRLVDQLAQEFNLEALPPQTVYRALQTMESQGWVTSEWDVDSGQGPPRKVFAITEAGKVALAAWATEVEELQDQLDAFLHRYRNL